MVTAAHALRHARAIGLDRLDAQLLVAHGLQRPRAWLLAHDDTHLTLSEQVAVADLLARRAAGEPVAYLVGEREFHGLSLIVTPEVLVPRPDTETLVDWAIELLAARTAPRVLDLGTGSGAIALAIKHACPGAELHASDASAAALAIARRNGERLGLVVSWSQGDWWDAIDATARFDLVITNPPYIAPGDPHLSSLRHEPQTALVAQDNGLADIERIVAGAPQRLRPSAWLLVEHGAQQAQAVCERLLRAGFNGVVTRPDLAGRPRVSGGVTTAPGA